MASLQEPLEGVQSYRHLDFESAKLISDFWPLEPREDKFLLFKANKLIGIVSSSHEKLIHRSLVIMIRAGIKISIVPILQMRKPSLHKSPKVTQQASDWARAQSRLTRF